MSQSPRTRPGYQGGSGAASGITGGRAVVLCTLLALWVVKAGLAAALYEPSRVWLHGDDYCRALMAYTWGRSPYLYPSDLHWLPLPFYLYGLASRIEFHDPQLSLVLVSQTLAALTLLPVYGLGRVLFSRTAGLLAAVLYTFAAWQTVMSFSALAEPLYYLLALSGTYCFVQWWLSGRLPSLAGVAVCLALAALTRYEAWLLLILIDLLAAVRIYQFRPPRRKALAAIALLLAAWLTPGLWVLANVIEYNALLAFYGANRQAFTESLYYLSPLQRAVWYPLAFVTLSVPLTAVLVLTFARPRLWARGPAAVLVSLALGHLAVMTGLYLAGSGPFFVERIVLFHLLVLMPVAAAGLARAWSCGRPIARAGMVVFLAAFAVWECYYARHIIISQRYSDYRGLSDHYTQMANFLRAELPTMASDAAVHCHDYGHFVRFSSGMPLRIADVTGESIEETLAARDIEVLCVPAADLAAWRVDDRIESAFRAAHKTDALAETQLGNWRIIRVKRDD